MNSEVSVTGISLPTRVRTISLTEEVLSGVPVYTVTLDVIGNTVSLRSGLTVDVQIPSGEVRHVVALAREAIVTDGANRFVTVEREDGTTIVPLTVGSSIDEETVEVRGALQVGDVVVYVKEQ